MANPIKKKCLNCGYELQLKDESELTPLSECPKCSAIYKNVEKFLIEKERKKKLAEEQHQSSHEIPIESSASKSLNKKKYLNIILIILIIILVGFAYRYVNNHFLEGDLNGEIFIVTKGRQNIRLGLVEVRLIPEDEIKKYTSDKVSQFKKEEEKILLKLENAKKKLDEYRDAYMEAHKSKVLREVDADFRETMNKVDVVLDRKPARTTDDKIRDIQADTAIKINEIEKEHLYKLAQLDYELLIKEASALSVGAFFFNGLPDGKIKTKTDADGKFSLRMKRGQRMALAAQSNRKIMGDDEDYYWLIWVSLEGKSNKKIILSNDNLVEENHSESVIHFKKVPLVSEYHP